MSQRDLRDCLGRFATGVAVMTCRDAQNEPCGITANSFSSVSLEPPLILWNLAKVSQTITAWLDSTYFGINVLRADQQALSAHFARSDRELFAGTEYRQTALGVPRLPGTIAWMECRRYATYDCGDHYILVGEVLDFAAEDGEPLLFFRGEYRYGVEP